MASELRRDFTHTFWMVGSTGTNAVLGFVSGLLLVAGLSQEGYGLASSALAVFLVAQELVGRGINDSMMRLGTVAAAGSAERANEVFRSGLILKLLFCAVAFAVYLSIPGRVAGALGRAELDAGMPGVLTAILGFGLWSFVLTRRQAKFEFGRLALIQPVSNLLRVGLLAALIGLGCLTWTRAIWVISGCLVVSAAVVGAGDWRDLLRLPWRFRPMVDALAEVWRFARWNLVAALCFAAYSRMDVFVLTRHAAPGEVGVYNAAWQVLTIVDLCNVTIMTVMIPKACHLVFYEDLLSWAGRTVVLATVVAVLSLPLLFFAEWYVPVLLGGEYARSVALVRTLYWGNVISLLVFPWVGILYAKKCFHLIAAMHVLLLAVSVPAYNWSIGRHGVAGAAWTTVGLRTAASVLLLVLVLWCLSLAPRRAAS